MTGLLTRGVVVGVNGSRGSHAALRFAIREAALRGSSLEAVTAWTDIVDGVEVDQSAVHTRRRAQEIQDAEIARTLSEVDSRPVLSRQVVQGEAGEVLSRAAKDAAYLVVGASTEGQWRRSRVGTVSDYCLRNAPCAVVVVREHQDAVTPDLAAGPTDAFDEAAAV